MSSGDAVETVIFHILQDHFGLRLEAQKVPVETVVIEDAQKPVGN